MIGLGGSNGGFSGDEPRDDDDGDGILPSVISVFPLDGAVLLPRGLLPLNIFEPRYLAMIRDAMAGSGLIGMIQSRGNAAPDGGIERSAAGGSRAGSEMRGKTATTKPALFGVGCAGRITECSTTDDGRLLVMLAGVTRFAVTCELEVTTPYRQVMPDFEPFAADSNEAPPLAAAARAALERELRGYLDTQGLSADWAAVAQADDESLVTTLSSVCPFDAVEKQALLEARDLPARAATLTALMTFAQGTGGGVTRQ